MNQPREREVMFDDDEEEVRGLPWWMGFAAGMTFGGIMVAFPVLITINNMRCTVFGFPM